jgi:hypothetical protein
MKKIMTVLVVLGLCLGVQAQTTVYNNTISGIVVDSMTDTSRWHGEGGVNVTSGFIFDEGFADLNAINPIENSDQHIVESPANGQYNERHIYYKTAAGQAFSSVEATWAQVGTLASSWGNDHLNLFYKDANGAWQLRASETTTNGSWGLVFKGTYIGELAGGLMAFHATWILPPGVTDVRLELANSGDGESITTYGPYIASVRLTATSFYYGNTISGTVVDSMMDTSHWYKEGGVNVTSGFTFAEGFADLNTINPIENNDQHVVESKANGAYNERHIYYKAAPGQTFSRVEVTWAQVGSINSTWGNDHLNLLYKDANGAWQLLASDTTTNGSWGLVFKGTYIGEAAGGWMAFHTTWALPAGVTDVRLELANSGDGDSINVYGPYIASAKLKAITYYGNTIAGTVVDSMTDTSHWYSEGGVNVTSGFTFDEGFSDLNAINPIENNDLHMVESTANGVYNERHICYQADAGQTFSRVEATWAQVGSITSTWGNDHLNLFYKDASGVWQLRASETTTNGSWGLVFNGTYIGEAASGWMAFHTTWTLPAGVTDVRLELANSGDGDSINVYGPYIASAKLTAVDGHYYGAGLLNRNETLTSGKFGTPYGWLEMGGAKLWEQYRKKNNAVGFNNYVKGFNVEGDAAQVQYFNVLQYTNAYDAPGLFIDYTATGPVTNAGKVITLKSMVSSIDPNGGDSFDVRMGFMENPAGFVTAKGGDNSSMDMYFGDWNTDGACIEILLDNRSGASWVATVGKSTQVAGLSALSEGGRTDRSYIVDGEIGVASTDPLPLSWRMYASEGSVYFEAKVGFATYKWAVNTTNPSNSDSIGYNDGAFAWQTSLPVLFVGRSAAYDGTIPVVCTIGIAEVETPKMPGDANGDGAVDVGDLGILAANYGGANKTWAQGDFNGDKLVDVGDLGILAANYGKNSSSSNWATDYAKAFGTTVADEEDADEISNFVCSGLGLPLMVGLALMGLMLVKLEE